MTAFFRPSVIFFKFHYDRSRSEEMEKIKHQAVNEFALSFILRQLEQFVFFCTVMLFIGNGNGNKYIERSVGNAILAYVCTLHFFLSKQKLIIFGFSDDVYVGRKANSCL